jgi:hypothetical protein
MSTIHIVFSALAAENLKTALHDAGREDRFVCYFDNLSLGPINPPDRHVRLKWFEQEFACNDECGFPNDEAFWRDALNENVRKVAWLSRRSAPEYAGFLEWEPLLL